MNALKAPRGFLAALFLLFAAAPALAAPTFPALTGRVVDDAHLLSADTQEKLTDELAQLETQTGHQVVVATIPSLQGYEIEDYGYQLGRAWGIGSKAQNDGVLLLVAPNERKVRIEVGYGLEPILTDALSSTIIQSKILPDFRSGNMEQGIIDGTEAIIAQLSLPEDQAKAIASAPPREDRVRTDGVHIPAIVIIFIVLWLLSAVLRGGGSGLWWLPFLILNSGGGRDRDRWGGGGGWGGGGFSGGGGSFGGGGSSGGW